MPFMQTPNLNMHYELAGDGDKVIVFLHGYFASWRWWQPALSQLPDGYRAYAPDLRGCGDTDRPPDGYTIQQLAMDLHQLATALELPPFHLVGHSLGGVVAMQFALDYPEQVQSLTLVAPGPAEGMAVFYQEKTHLPPPMHLFEIRRETSLSLLDTTYRFLQSTEYNRRILRRALKRMLLTLPEDDYFTALVDDASRMAPQAVVGYIEAVDSWHIQDQLATIDLPTIILWGDEDTLIPQAAPLKRTAKGLGGRLVIWTGLGHAPQLEQPQRFKRFLTRFLRTVDQPQPASPNWLQSLWQKLSHLVSNLSGRLSELARS